LTSCVCNANQVLRREQFILASGISAVVVGLLQMLGPWAGAWWTRLFGLDLAAPRDFGYAVFWIVLPLVAVNYAAGCRMIHAFTTESLSVP